jgi:hypothetical protein
MAILVESREAHLSRKLARYSRKIKVNECPPPSIALEETASRSASTDEGRLVESAAIDREASSSPVTCKDLEVRYIEIIYNRDGNYLHLQGLVSLVNGRFLARSTNCSWYSPSLKVAVSGAYW